VLAGDGGGGVHVAHVEPGSVTSEFGTGCL
jgi:hypothetical protein